MVKASRRYAFKTSPGLNAPRASLLWRGLSCCGAGASIGKAFVRSGKWRRLQATAQERTIAEIGVSQWRFQIPPLSNFRSTPGVFLNRQDGCNRSELASGARTGCQFAAVAAVLSIE